MSRAYVARPSEAGVGWVLLAIAGLSYWFWLGFPFANHNESYAWIAQFRSMSLLDAITRHLIGVANVRPLGTGAAWLAYRAFNGSIAPVELFNYLLAAAAWALLAWKLAQRRVFALAALAVGGGLFSGYVYLFHLHGIFYSPLLALVALLLLAGENRASPGHLSVLFLIAAVAALFHPFALPLFAAWVVGAWLERRAPTLPAVMAIVASVALARLILSGARSVPFGPETWSGLVVSYRMVEIHPLVTGLALVLIAITAATTRIPAPARFLYATALLAAALALAAGGASSLPVWILACLVKLALARRWSWAAMLLLAAIFPIAYPTGSPTYTVPAWMMCAATLSLGAERLEAAMARVPAMAPWAAVAVIAAAGLAVRSGMSVPALSRLAEPLAAERERTFQMEAVIQWALGSTFRDDRLVLYREARSPNEAENAVDRLHRPPTQQAHLDRYMDERRPGPAGGATRLLVTFGGEAVPAARLVFRLPGAHAGDARVYEQTGAQEPAGGTGGTRRGGPP